MINLHRARLTVVITGDDAYRQFVKTALPADEFEILPAADGVMCLDLYETHHPDFMILRLDTPRLNGIEITQQIRAKRASQPYILIAMSEIDQAVLQAALEAGVDDFMVDAIPPALLRQRVRNLAAPTRLPLHVYGRLYDRIPSGVFICGSEGRLVMVNEQFCQMLGHSQAELLQMNLLQLTAAPDRQRLSLVLLGLTSSEPLTVNLVTQNNGHIPVALNIDVVERNYMVGLASDLRSTRAAQLELKRSEQKYRSIFDTANDAILIVDARTDYIIDANKNAVRWLGYTLDSLQGMTYRALINAGDTTPLNDALETLNTYGRHIYEVTLQRRDGQHLPVEVSARVIDHDNQPAVLNVVRDISRRRLMEQQERDQSKLAVAINETAAVVNSSLELEKVLAHILDTVVQVIPGDSSNVMLIDNEGYTSVKLQRGGEDSLPGAPLGLSIHTTEALRLMYEHKRGLIINDVYHDTRWIHTGRKQWIKSYVGAPLVVDGQAIGFINIDGANVNQFTPLHLQYLQMFAAQASLAIRNARLYTQVQEYASELEKRVLERTQQLSFMNQSLQEQIQERKRVEQTLAEERNRLRALIDALPDQVYMKDRNSRFTLLNATCQQNMPPRVHDKSVIGLTDFEIYDPDQAQQWFEEEQRLFENGQAIINREEQWYDSTNGRRITLLVSKIPLHDSDGHIDGLLGINHNITDLRQAEDSLAHIISSANCLLWYADVQQEDEALIWDIHITSESAARRFMPLKMEVGQSYESAWDAAIYPEDMAELRKHTENALSAGASGYSYETRILREDGKTRWLSFDVRVISALENQWGLVGICTDITERKLLEEVLRQSNEELESRVQERAAALEAATQQLRESEEKYRTLTNQLPVGVYRISADYTFHYANMAMAHMLGATAPEDLMGDTVNNYWLRPELAHEQVRRTLPPPNVARQDEFRLRRRDGRLIWVRNTWHAIYDEDGALLSIDGSLEDITVRKLAQIAEYEQRTFAEALSEAAADLNGTLDLDKLLDRILAQITRVMPEHEADEIVLLEDDNQTGHIIRFQQRTAEGISTEPYFQRFALSYIPNFVHMRDTAKPIIIHDTQTSTRWKHVPQAEWIRAYLGVPILSEGQVIGFISLTASKPYTFIEQHAARLMAFANQVGIAIKNARLYAKVQRSAEDLRQQVDERTRALSRQTALLNTILNALNEGVIYFGAEGATVFSNQSMLELMQLMNMTNFTSRSLQQMIDMPEQNYSKLLAEVRHDLATRGRWEGEVRIRRLDGQTFDAFLNVVQITDLYGANRGALVVMRDISREKAIEEQRRRFVSYASHELRTPITNLNTRLYLMRKQPERINEHLEVVEMVVKRMRQLAEDLLDISRIERGALTLERQVMDFRELVAEVASLQAPEAEQKDIMLTTVLPESPVLVSVDRGRIWRVISNLTTNAIRYTEQGTITLELVTYDQQAALTVRDTGTGIAPEILPDIFKLFVRGKQDNSGSGLGLTIARELVELHGGSISVESELGVGTAFTVLLDLYNESAPQINSEETAT